MTDSSVSLRQPAASLEECCDIVTAQQSASNPIIMYSLVADAEADAEADPSSASSNGSNGTVAVINAMCVMHRLRILQQPVVYPRPAAWLATQSSCSQPSMTYYAPDDTSCAGFTASVGDLRHKRARGVSEEDSTLTVTPSVADAAECCALCTASDRCVAHQFTSSEAANTSGTCRTVSSAVLAQPEVTAVDVAGWASSLPIGDDASSLTGLLYHREPPGSSLLTTSTSSASNTSAPPALTCEGFEPLPSAGATLLDGPGSRFLGGDSTRSILYEGVTSEGACCELAKRWGCNANPVRMWQLVEATLAGGGLQYLCVVHRSDFLGPASQLLDSSPPDSAAGVPPTTSRHHVPYARGVRGRPCVAQWSQPLACARGAAAQSSPEPILSVQNQDRVRVRRVAVLLHRASGGVGKNPDVADCGLKRLAQAF